MRRNFCIIVLVSITIILAGCKPTEKGYKSAYDAALNKREAVKGDLDVTLSHGEFQEVDGPQLKEIDGSKVYVLNRRIVPADFVMELPENYNVAIGEYKMITNCKAQAEALLSEGYHAFPAKDEDGMYYTIAGSFNNIGEAIKFYTNYQKKPNQVFVGLPGAPVIIYSPK